MNKNVVIKLSVIVAVLMIVSYVSKSNVDYLDTNCPVCGSSEVGNTSTTSEVCGHCFDCGTDFSIDK